MPFSFNNLCILVENPPPPEINLAKLAQADESTHPLLAFNNWRVNAFVPPLLLSLAGLANQSPLSFLLDGFHVWMHEFGHATAAWMTGRKATPLPIGWTPIEPDYSPFVYFGLLLMFGILFVAGWKERKPWPMVIAVALAVVQYYMTWRMPSDRQEMWYGAFCGVGGEFYLSTLLMIGFYIQLPEKFRWGFCRYVFFFIAASVFLKSVHFWNEVYHGREDIPMGSMINGEDDNNGDMNKLMDAYDWTKFNIRHAYQFLGYYCWAALGIVYAIFVLRLNLLADWIVGKFGAVGEAKTD